MKKVIKILLYLLFVFSILIGGHFLYKVSKKYDDVSIISLKREYNLVICKETDYVSIPLYFDRQDTYLSSYKEVESVNVSNDQTVLSSFLERIEYNDYIYIDNTKYYEYDFILSFKLYDDFKEPLFMSDSIFNINYQNNEQLSFRIGNMSILFNKSSLDNTDLYLTKLQSVSNIIDNKEIIVGLNIGLKNSLNNDIKINSIKIKNKYYDLDYLSYKTELLTQCTNLKEKYNNYSYITNSLPTGNMDYLLESNNSMEFFLPLKYLRDILYVDRFPIYIEYEVNGEIKTYIVDDFMFISQDPISSSNGYIKYVYKYD